MDWSNRKSWYSHRNDFLSLSSLKRWLRQKPHTREDEYTWTRLLKTRLVKTRPIARTLRDWHRRPTVFWRVYWQIELGFDHGVFDPQIYHHSVSDHLSAQRLAVDSSVFAHLSCWCSTAAESSSYHRSSHMICVMETTSYFWQTRAKHW